MSTIWRAICYLALLGGTFELCRPGFLPVGLQVVSMAIIMAYVCYGHPFQAQGVEKRSGRRCREAVSSPEWLLLQHPRKH